MSTGPGDDQHNAPEDSATGRLLPEDAIEREESPGHGFDTVVAALAEVRDAVLVIAGSVERYGLNAKREANRVRNWHDTWGCKTGCR